MAARCDDTARLVPELRKASASVKLVAPERLAAAVSRYIDWEAFAYWVRPGLELGSPLPQEVVRELRRRCPGFLEVQQDKRDWQQLMSWIADQGFWHSFDTVWLHFAPRAGSPPRCGWRKWFRISEAVELGG
jgi:hypothetical protein